MTDQGRDEIDTVIDHFLGYLAGNEPTPSLERLTEDEREQVEPMLRVLRASWRAALEPLPPIEKDPTARALGLVSSDSPLVPLNGRAVRKARQQKHISPSQIDAALTVLGIPSGWTYDLEQRELTYVSPEVADALARVLAVSSTDLESISTIRRDRGWDAFARSRRFTDEVREWARERGLEVDLAAVRALAGARLTNAAFRRSGESDEEEWASLLRTLLESWAR